MTLFPFHLDHGAATRRRLHQPRAREGTLGLLFLTPLRPQDVVIAKGFAHGLRAMTLWLAVIPTLIIPFLVGGVGWREALLVDPR